MLDHLPRETRLALQLRRDGIERIEEEMRVQLHAQRVQASFRELPLESFAGKLARKIAPIVLISLPGADNDPINEPVPQEHAAQCIRKRLRIAQSRQGTEAQERFDCEKNVDEQRSEKQA